MNDFERIQSEQNAAKRERSRAVVTVAGIALLALALMVGVFFVLDWRDDGNRTAAAGPVLAAPRAADTAPELLAAAVALQTFVAPTGTPLPRTPTPTPRPVLPTPVPFFCGVNSYAGAECVWPQPTPTPEPPLPDCGTPVPEDVCIWKGAFYGPS